MTIWLVVLIAASGVAALSLLVLFALRASERGRRFRRLPLRAKLAFGRALLADGGTPRGARLLLLVLVGYLLMPFDLVPDFIPVLGQLDDLLIAGAAVACLLVMIPGPVLDAALARAEREG